MKYWEMINLLYPTITPHLFDYVASVHTVLQCTVLFCTVLNHTALPYIPPYCTILHYSIIHWTTVHSTPLHCTALHYSTLHYTTLHYTPVYGTVRTCCRWSVLSLLWASRFSSWSSAGGLYRVRGLGTGRDDGLDWLLIQGDVRGR